MRAFDGVGLKTLYYVVFLFFMLKSQTTFVTDLNYTKFPCKMKQTLFDNQYVEALSLALRGTLTH